MPPLVYVISSLLLVSTIAGLPVHPVLAVPTVSVSPNCGPAQPGFNIVVTGNGFKPNSIVAVKFVTSDGKIPLYTQFDTDNTGGFNDVTFADDLNEGHYKLYLADDSDGDGTFDIGARRVYADVTIPCPAGTLGSLSPSPPGNLTEGFTPAPPPSSVPTTTLAGNIDGVPTTGNLTEGFMTQGPSTFASDPTTSLKEFGVFFGPIQKHFGVFHNENGVFIPWTTLCPQMQAYLVQSCSSLTNPDGSLTASGNTAVECISNGALMTGAAAMFNLPVDTIKGILSSLAKPTGCDNIVDLNTIPNSPDIQRLLQFASTAALK